jgi:NAD(P)-dependent dehydrogenase (short-subunit alcohol dehydrogenase family)
MSVPDTPPFTGDVVLVTGAGRGLGRAYAQHLAARGARVVVNDIDAEPVHDTVASIGSGRAVACVADIATGRGAHDAVAAALDTFGRIDALVCNAGTSWHLPFADMTEADLHTVLDSSLFGTFHPIRAAWPHLVAQGHGRIVTTASDAVFGYAGRGHYAAAKGAVLGLTNTVGVEGAPHGIFANTIMPYGTTRLSTAGAAVTDPLLAAPAVAWLCHRACTENAQTFLTGGGRFVRVVHDRRPVQPSGGNDGGANTRPSSDIDPR